MMIGDDFMIILLNASPRKYSATATILQYISEQLQHQNINTTIIHVSDMNLNYCIGCYKCYENGKCIFMDDIETLSIKIKKADGIIIATPTYASNISGQLKTIIDRGHFVMEQLLHHKYAMSVVTYENYGGKDTAKILNKLLFNSGAILTRPILVKYPYSKNPLTSKKIKRKIMKKTNYFYLTFLKQKKPTYQKLKHFIIFYFGIFPFVIRNKSKFSGVISAWKKNNII